MSLGGLYEPPSAIRARPVEPKLHRLHPPLDGTQDLSSFVLIHQSYSVVGQVCSCGARCMCAVRDHVMVHLFGLFLFFLFADLPFALTTA